MNQLMRLKVVSDCSRTLRMNRIFWKLQIKAYSCRYITHKHWEECLQMQNMELNLQSEYRPLIAHNNCIFPSSKQLRKKSFFPFSNIWLYLTVATREMKWGGLMCSRQHLRLPLFFFKKKPPQRHHSQNLNRIQALPVTWQPPDVLSVGFFVHTCL